MARVLSRFLVFLLFVALAGAKSAAAQAQAPPAAASSSADMSKISTEAVDWLAGLIRINTTNPPGNELAAAKYLADILQREGIAAEIIESAPGRGILVARMNAGAMPDSSRALLLMGHMDVVGVQKEKWTVDPFGAVMKDGYLYGRGAIDDKGMTIANVAVMVALKRGQVHLNRDIILLAEGDEEAGGDYGIDFAVQKHWDKIAAGFALNEGGRVFLKDGRVQWVGIQASEKIPVNVIVTAKGTSGHASVPLKDNPIVHLSAAIEKIGNYATPWQLNSVTRVYFEQIAKIESEDISKWMRALETPDRGDHAARFLSDQNPVWSSTLRTTIAPTIFQGGFRENVVPSEAKATLNIRLLPGDMIDPLVAKLKTLVDDPAVQFEVQSSARGAAPSSSLETDFYRIIEQTAIREFPGSIAVPMMSTGATDSAPLRLRSVQAYGLLPFPLDEEDLKRMHGDNERIPVASFQKGISFLYQVVSTFAVSK